ncbi:hypothetical protein ASG21_04105 [Chryseobacterium sp. Leaf394]|nr:hypothetical protein ASG21_04105 [Chryseobacterium sp. Leaf394]
MKMIKVRFLNSSYIFVKFTVSRNCQFPTVPFFLYVRVKVHLISECFWIDIINSFGGDNAEPIMENVAFGENAAMVAYESALTMETFSSKLTLSHKMCKLKS